MPQITKQVAYRVSIIESERGWGSKIEDQKYFDNEAEAKAFVLDYNKQNDQGDVPDWYMYASYDGKV